MSENKRSPEDRFVEVFFAKDRHQATTAINNYALKKNLSIVSTSLCVNQGEFITMVVFEKINE